MFHRNNDDDDNDGNDDGYKQTMLTEDTHQFMNKNGIYFIYNRFWFTH